MESITIQAAEQFRNNMEDRSPTKPEVMSRVEETQDEGEEEEDIWPKVMSGVEETQDGGEEEEDCWTMESITIQAAEQFWNNMEDRRPLQPEVKTQDRGVAVVHYHKLLQLELEMLHITQRLMELNGTGRGLLLQKRVNEERKRKEREVWGAAEKIKTETQELQQDTTSQSDPKVTHTAGFIQKMSEEMLKQKERLSDNKMSVKETCRDVKIVLQQITDLVEDTLQSLSEDAKLKLESLIKIFYKMTASMWKLMFCALLLYKLREVLDLLKSDSYNISLSRGRLKYAFKMASMLALWLSHDVESNPGPEFNPRTCIEMLVRRLSESLREDLEIGGTIWSIEVANAAYDAGFSNTCHWKNPSGKNKDSLPDLIERAKELGRVLTERNCLPTGLAPFTVDLDHQETQDRLRQHLKTESYKAAVDALMCEPDFTSSTTEAIRRLTQLVQEKMSNVTRHHTARSPPLTTTNSEFGQLADSQSVTNTVCEETNSIISNIVTRYQSKRRQRRKNKNPKTKQISNVTASELCTATGIHCHDMLTGGTMVEGAETDSSPGRLSNSHCTLSTSTPDTTDTPHQDQNIMEAETTGNSDFVRMTLEIIRENEMKSTSGTSGTDSSHASVAEHAMISDSNSFDETKVNNDSEEPNQEGQRNIDLVSPSPRNGGVEMPGDILGHISLTPDTSDDTFYAGLASVLFNFMQGDDANTAVTDTEMNDVPLPTYTADEALLANIGNDPFSVMTGDDRKTSSCDASNPDNSPDDDTQQDAADEGCEDEETDTSQPSQKAGVPTEDNQLDQPNTATDRCQDQNEDASREERTERHESQSVAGLGANRPIITSTDTETDNEMRVITAGTDTDMRMITVGTSTHVSEIQPQADDRKSAEENEYITKSEFQAILSQQYVRNSGIERRLQELEALNGLEKTSSSKTADFTLNQVHLGESDTSLGSISASGGVTEEAGRRKRKRRQQHPPTKKKRQ